MWLAPLAVGAAVAGPVIQPEGLHTTKIEAPKFDVDPSLAPSRCVVRVEIDAAGTPTATEARACPPKFAAVAETAVRAWRWAPPTGAAASAVTLVAVEFTGRGRVPVAPAERCTYTLRVTADGRVAATGTPAPQCAIWPLATLPGRVPAVGTCAVAIDGGIVRDTYGWAVPDACSELGAQVAAAVAGGSLFAEGTVSTRIVVETPDPATAGAGVGVDVRGPQVDAGGGGGRIGVHDASARPLDPTMAPPDATKAPTVNMAELLEQRKKAGGTPPPVEEDEDEDEADDEEAAPPK